VHFSRCHAAADKEETELSLFVCILEGMAALESLEPMEDGSSLPLFDLFDDFQLAGQQESVFAGLQQVASAQIPGLRAHPLYRVLVDLVERVRGALLRESVDVAWCLTETLQAALATPAAQECAFVDERGALRFSPDEQVDDFVFSTLSLYDMILDSLRQPLLRETGAATLAQHARTLLAPTRTSPAAASVASISRSCFEESEEDEAHVPRGADGSGDGAHTRRLPRDADQHLKAWLLSHTMHPFPDDDEKDMLVLKTGLTRIQISNYFINARRRLLERLPDGTFRARTPGSRRSGIAKAPRRTSNARGRQKEAKEVL
jgi:hypothetical protein